MSDQSSTPKPAYDEFWQEAVDLAGGGGGGIIAKVTVETGWKIYVSNMSNKATFFPCPFSKNDPARAATKLVADEAAKKAGASHGPSWSINMTAYLSDAYTRGVKVTWKDDRYFTYDIFTSGAKQIVIPALMQFGIHTPWIGWVRIGFKDDPYGGTEKDQNGEERPKQIAYITEVFANEAAAHAAVAVGADEGEDASKSAPLAPPGYSPSSWATLVPMIKAEVAKGATIPALAATYGVPVNFIAAALGG